MKQLLDLAEEISLETLSKTVKRKFKDKSGSKRVMSLRYRRILGRISLYYYRVNVPGGYTGNIFHIKSFSIPVRNLYDKSHTFILFKNIK